MTRYVATRPLKVEGRMVAPGEEVPEAAGWRNRKAYIAGGYLAEVPGEGEGPDMERVEQLEAEVKELKETLASVVEQLTAGAEKDPGQPSGEQGGDQTPPAEDGDPNQSTSEGGDTAEPQTSEEGTEPKAGTKKAKGK